MIDFNELMKRAYELEQICDLQIEKGILENKKISFSRTFNYSLKSTSNNPLAIANREEAEHTMTEFEDKIDRCIKEINELKTKKIPHFCKEFINDLESEYEDSEFNELKNKISLLNKIINGEIGDLTETDYKSISIDKSSFSFSDNSDIKEFAQAQLKKAEEKMEELEATLSILEKMEDIVKHTNLGEEGSNTFISACLYNAFCHTPCVLTQTNGGIQRDSSLYNNALDYLYSIVESIEESINGYYVTASSLAKNLDIDDIKTAIALKNTLIANGFIDLNSGLLCFKKVKEAIFKREIVTEQSDSEFEFQTNKELREPQLMPFFGKDLTKEDFTH